MKIAIIALAAMVAAVPAVAQQSTPSPAFQQAVDKMHAACAADFHKYCPTATDQASRTQCMMANQDKLSDDCKTALSTLVAMSRSAGG